MGPAGDRFDAILADVFLRLGQEFKWAVTNTVACAPYNDEYDIDKPKQAHLKACMPRVIELLNILQPKCCILLGNEAQKGWNLIHTATFKRKYPFESIPSLKVAHPSWIEHYCSDPDLEHKRAVLAVAEFSRRYI